MRRSASLLAALTAFAMPAVLSAQYERVATDRPRLVVFLTVDQLRPDYLDRWAPQLTGGLGRLSKRGAFFTNAFHDHAVTETAPGHSVTMAGRFPRSTGILGNDAGLAVSLPRLRADRLDPAA
jgi:predicted AlkP superfamily pyrophosphatase or phosphodiesterase